MNCEQLSSLQSTVGFENLKLRVRYHTWVHDKLLIVLIFILFEFGLLSSSLYVEILSG